MPYRTRSPAPRTFTPILAYLFITIALTGCKRDPEPPTGGTPLPPGTLVAVIGPCQAHPSWPGIRGGAQRYGQRPYVSCLTVAPESNDPAALQDLVDQTVGRNPLAICLCVDDPDIARPAAQRIVRADILLVTIGRRIDGVNTYGHVAVNWPGAASLLGENLDKIAAGRLSYVLVHQDQQDRRASLCYARFTAAARSRSALKLLEQRNAAKSGRSQRELVEELRQRFPHVGLVVTLSPEPWVSRQPWMKLPPENRFATLGAPPRLWSRLRSGEAAALVGPLEGDIGYAAVDMAVTGLMGIPDTPRERTVPCELVMLDTLDDFARRYAAAANLDVAELMPLAPVTPPGSQPNDAPPPPDTPSRHSAPAP